jgi:hypothetical protein
MTERPSAGVTRTSFRSVNSPASGRRLNLFVSEACAWPSARDRHKAHHAVTDGGEDATPRSLGVPAPVAQMQEGN